MVAEAWHDHLHWHYRMNIMCVEQAKSIPMYMSGFLKVCRLFWVLDLRQFVQRVGI